ncbi:MAG: glycosyltransferase family 2 protein [Clostridia bacterium]|nr:glycosyltransferase family 2 protein [Clostridia bacterium]
MSTLFKSIFNYIVYLFEFLIDYVTAIKETFLSFSRMNEMNIYEIADTFKAAITYVLAFLCAYRIIYTIVGAITTRKFKPTNNKHKYAVLIAARNEEKVIGNLLDSLNKQDYPSDLITTFVIADNCTDKTAEIARKYGATVYERFDNERRTKGFALQFLFNRIEEDFGIKSFEGYFIFDADNLVKKDYVTRMNEAFDEGEKIICSYRNTKNFDDNWISASYAIHWLRSIRLNNRPRSYFNVATNIQGTGFLFSNEFVLNGWNYTSLTEDRAFTADAVANGHTISYNDAAEFYDEQPTGLKIALRQRTRWGKGHILAFFESGGKLLKNIFTSKGFRQRFMSLDILLHITPINLIEFLFALFSYVCYFIIYINQGFLSCILTILGWRAAGRLGMHLYGIAEATYVFISERKRIKKIKWYKKIWYSFMWPLFDFIGAWTMYASIFMKVSWKPIPHDSQVKIEDTQAVTIQKELVKKN